MLISELAPSWPPSPSRINSKHTTKIPIKTKEQNSSSCRKKTPLSTVSGQFAPWGNLCRLRSSAPAPRHLRPGFTCAQELCHANPHRAETHRPLPGPSWASTPNAADHLEQNACTEVSRSLSTLLPSFEPAGLFSNSPLPFSHAGQALL